MVVASIPRARARERTLLLPPLTACRALTPSLATECIGMVVYSGKLHLLATRLHSPSNLVPPLLTMTEIHVPLSVPYRTAGVILVVASVGSSSAAISRILVTILVRTASNPPP